MGPRSAGLAEAGVTQLEPEPEPTYHARIAGILGKHCQSCHAVGGIGPMPLVSFEDAKTHAAAIAYQTSAGHMPPWLPSSTASCAKLEHTRALPDADRRAIARWVELGAPEGAPVPDPSSPRATTSGTASTRDWTRLRPEPDRVVTPGTAYVPKSDRTDDYHCFVLDPKLDRPERIIGLRVQPGLPALVHHVLLFEVRANAVPRVTALDEKEPGAGYTCFGGIGVAPTIRPGNLAKGELVDFDAQMIVGWAPGAGATATAGAPTPLPADTAIQVAPGSRLVMQVHYSLSNVVRGAARQAADATRVDLWFARGDATPRQAVWVPLLKYDFRVPAGVGPDDPRARAHAEIDLPLPLEVRGVAPHMHLRGSAIRVDTFPEETSQASCLLDVPRWDFHHQEGYWLERSVRTRKAALTCTWDNRAEHQPVTRGKRAPPRELRWGEGTDDEMCLAFLYATL